MWHGAGAWFLSQKLKRAHLACNLILSVNTGVVGTVFLAGDLRGAHRVDRAGARRGGELNGRNSWGPRGVASYQKT